MNISLERLFEGIIATLRADVIPNVGDAYARGERPRFASGLPAVLGAASGISDERLAAAFESMSRHARERRWAERS